MRNIDEVSDLGMCDERSTPKAAAQEMICGVLFGDECVREVRIPRGDVTRWIAEVVAEPVVIHVVEGLDFWIGKQNRSMVSRNLFASRALREVLQAATAGEYGVSDRERDRVQTLLAHPEEVPVVHGPCVVLGSGAAAELPEAFVHWWARTKEAWIDELVKRLWILWDIFEPDDSLLSRH